MGCESLDHTQYLGIHSHLLILFMKLNCLGMAFLAPVLSLTLYAQSPVSTEPSVQVHDFLPHEDVVLTLGGDLRVSAAVSLTPSAKESIVYIGTITVNGRSRRNNGPFNTVLSPPGPGGTETINETMSWFVRVKGPKRMIVQLRLNGAGKSPPTNFTFAEISRAYTVKCSPKTFLLFRLIERTLGYCS